MLEQTLSYLHTIDPVWICVILFLFSFIENVFPPSPSDVIVIFGSAIIAPSLIGFISILIIASIGSALGFILMYFVGKIFGEKILRTGKLKFIDQAALFKVDVWFRKHGYKLILANRFIPGARSVISFFSGMHELHLGKTFIFSAVSAFLWNAVIIFAGMKIGQNADKIDFYLTAYSNIVISLILLVIAFFIFRFFYKRKKK